MDIELFKRLIQNSPDFADAAAGDRWKNDVLGKLQNQLNNDQSNKNKALKGIAKDISDIFENASRQEYAPEASSVGRMYASNYSKYRAKHNMAVSGVLALGETLKDTGKDYIKEQSYLLKAVNEDLNISGKLSEDFRESISKAQPELVRMGIGFKDLTDAAKRLVEDTGKFQLVGTETMVRAGEIAAAYGMKMEEIVGSYASFEQVGIGAVNAQEALSEAGKRSLELGIQSKNTMKGMIENIGKLNEYGFENGSEGLERMVRRATEVRMNLQSVFTIADKVFDPEGALDLAANLQVLGSSFGEFNDPLRLMYMATNNVEGLQGALEGVVNSLATYNTESGGFEVTGINLRRAREIAKQFGIEVGEVNRIAIATQERMSSAMALEGFSIEDKDKEFLTNLARMENGKMTIDLLTPELQKQFEGAKNVALENLTQDQVDVLLEYRKDLVKLTEGDLVRKQVTLVENINRNLNYMVTTARLRAAGNMDDVIKSLSGMDFKEMGQNFSEILEMDTDKILNMFGREQAVAIESFQNNMKMNSEKLAEILKVKEDKETETDTKSTTKVEHIHKVGVDQQLGYYQKEWSLNPEKWLSPKDDRSYTQSR